MSLIHSALKQMDMPAGQAMSTPSAVPETNLSLVKNMAFTVAGLVAVLAVAAGIWLVLQPDQILLASKQPAPQMLGVMLNSFVKPSAVTPLGTVKPTVDFPATQNVPAEPKQPAPLAAVVVQKTIQSTKVVARQAEAVERITPANKQPELVGTGSAKAKPLAVAEPAPAELSVDKSLALFLQATNNNDLPGALVQLKIVQQQTLPGNVSRVRAEAWYALRKGDTAAAKRSYADILDRFPDDEEASINLASLEAREGRGEAARQLLANALRSHPDSEVLHDALERFRAPTGN